MMIGYFVVALMVLWIDALFCAFAQRRFRWVNSLIFALIWPIEMIVVCISVAIVSRELPDFGPGDLELFRMSSRRFTTGVK